jgi:hypothetical protein
MSESIPEQQARPTHAQVSASDALLEDAVSLSEQQWSDDAMRLRTIVYLGNLALKFETLAADSRERSEAREAEMKRAMLEIQQSTERMLRADAERECMLRREEERRVRDERKAEERKKEERGVAIDAEFLAGLSTTIVAFLNERQERMPPMHDGLLDAGDGTWIPAPYGVKRGADGKWSPLPAPKTRR